MIINDPKKFLPPCKEEEEEKRLNSPINHPTSSFYHFPSTSTFLTQIFRGEASFREDSPPQPIIHSP